MPVSLRSFELAIDKALEGIETDANTFKRHVALDLLTRIVEKTPVDTGRARANWQVSVNAPETTQVSYRNDKHINAERDESGVMSKVIGEGGMVIESVELGEDIFITNNLPYIEVLETGDHSDQAPQGMVALSVAEVNEGFIKI